MCFQCYKKSRGIGRNTTSWYFIYVLMRYVRVTGYLSQHPEMLVDAGAAHRLCGRRSARPVALRTRTRSAVLCCAALRALRSSLHLRACRTNGRKYVRPSTASVFPASMEDTEGCFLSTKTTCLNIAWAITHFFLLWKIPYDISPEGLLGKLTGM